MDLVSRAIIGDRMVGPIGLGTAPLAFSSISFEAAVATVRAAIAAGVTFIDTAPAYTRDGFESFAESAVAVALHGLGDRADVLVATKGGHRRAEGGFPVDASPVALRADCERSLRALGAEAIDLYQLHHVDPRVALIDSVGALRELQNEGKVVVGHTLGQREETQAREPRQPAQPRQLAAVVESQTLKVVREQVELRVAHLTAEFKVLETSEQR